MPVLTAEQVTIIRAGLDASAYQAGANVIVEANKRIDASGAAVVQTQAATTRGMTDSGGAFDRYRQRVDQSYAAIQQFSRIQEAANAALRLGRTTVEDANTTLAAYAAKLGLVGASAQGASRRIAEAAQAAQALAAAQAAVNRFAGVRPPTSTEDYARRQADIAAYGASLDALKARYNPLFAASQQYQASLAAVGTAEKTGAITAAEAASARGQATTALRDAIAANQAYAASIDPLVQAHTRATAAQTAVNRFAGVRAPVSPTDHAARNADIQAYGAALDQARAKYDPLFAARQRHEATLAEIAGFERAGALSADAATAARERAAKTLADATGATRMLGAETGKLAAAHQAGAVSAGNMAFATRQLGVQSVQAISGIATGQGVLTVLIQQGHQVVDVALSTGTGFGVVKTAAAAMWGAIASPVGIATAAIGVLGVFGFTAETTARRLAQSRNEFSLVRDDFVRTSAEAEAMAKHLAVTSYLSTADSRAGAGALFTANGGAFQGTRDQGEAIIKIFHDLSIALGESETNWGRLKEAMVNPAALMQTMLDQNHLTGLNQGMVNHIRLLQEAGNKAAATSEALDILAKAQKHVADNKTPLQQALNDLSREFTEAGQNGRTFSEVIGENVTNSARGAIYALLLLKRGVQELGGQMKTLWESIPGLAGGGVPLGAQGPVPGTGGVSPNLGVMPPGVLTGRPGPRGAIPAYAAAAIDEIAGHLGLAKALDDFATRIAQVESGGRHLDRDGRLKTSSAGALGMMQVMPDSYFGPGSATGRTVDGKVWDLTDEQQNIEAGLRILRQLYQQFGGDLSKVAVGYNGGPDALNRDALKAETLGYLAKLGLPEPPHGNFPGGPVPGGAQVLPTIPATGATGVPIPVAPSIPIPPVPPGGIAPPAAAPRTGREDAPNNWGIVNTSADQTKLADEYAKALGVSGAAAEDARAKILALNKALALPNQSVAETNKWREALQKAELELYNAVPASQALLRSIGQQTEAEDRMTSAWGHGANAAAVMAARIKAETDARQFAAPGTAAYIQLVEVLTAKLNAQARASQNAALAQQTSVSRDNLSVLQAEIELMSADERTRTLVLARLREEIDLKQRYPQASQAFIDGLIAQDDKLRAQSYDFTQQKSAMQDFTNSVSASFDSLGTAVSDAFLGGKTAGQAFGNAMDQIAKQVLQTFLKLAIINPLLNEIFPGSAARPTLGGLGGALGGGGMIGGSATAGGSPSGIGAIGGPVGALAGNWASISQGVSNLYEGSWLQGLFGGGTAAPISVGLESLNASGVGMFGLNSVAASILHEGGTVGLPGGTTRFVHPAYFDDAPRFHAGLGNDEFAAILQKGERVLTARQNTALTGMLSQGGGGPTHEDRSVTHNWNITTPDADSFLRSKGQLTAMVASAMGQTANKMRTRS